MPVETPRAESSVRIRLVNPRETQVQVVLEPWGKSTPSRLTNQSTLRCEDLQARSSRSHMRRSRLWFGAGPARRHVSSKASRSWAARRDAHRYRENRRLVKRRTAGGPSPRALEDGGVGRREAKAGRQRTPNRPLRSTRGGSSTPPRTSWGSTSSSTTWRVSARTSAARSS